MSGAIIYGFFSTVMILLIGVIGCIADLIKTVYIGDKADKLARSMTDRITRETELRIKRDFKRGIFD